jgi:hypothetical protein
MRNLQRRTVDTDPSTLGALLDRVDELWPTRRWPPMRLDRGIEMGVCGGHAPVRYRVVNHKPGRRVRFQFAPDFGVEGFHELRVEGPVLVHEVAGRTVNPLKSWRL